MIKNEPPLTGFPDWTRDAAALEAFADEQLLFRFEFDLSTPPRIPITISKGDFPRRTEYVLGWCEMENDRYQWRPLEAPLPYSPGPLFDETMPRDARQHQG